MSIEEVVVTKRPFRLMVGKEFLRWRMYKYHRAAVIGALIEAKWAKVGTTIEVIDVRNGKLIGSYTRTVNSVQFHKEKQNVVD